MRSVTLTLCLALATLVPLRCGPSNAVRVTGTLLKGGAPYTPPEGQSIQLTFSELDAPGSAGGSEPFPAQFNPADATFTVPGREGWGIPPGRYRLAVIRKPKAGEAVSEPTRRGDRAPLRDRDYLDGQFGPTTSPIVRDLYSSDELTIDLDHPTE